MIRFWFWLLAQISYYLSSVFLKIYGKWKPYQTLTWKPFTWRGLKFTNPLSIAGEVDKNADHVRDWWTLGVGFIEVGTVTPEAQGSNFGKILDRDIKSQNFWHHMGCPSKGIDHLFKNLRYIYRPHFTPIFVNIGKNWDTPLEMAQRDYIKCMKTVSHLADAFVINISDSNTKELRNLLKPKALSSFLGSIKEAHFRNHVHGPFHIHVPLLLKLSPNISEVELHNILKISLDMDIDGWILTSTTFHREDGSSFPKNGGVSGRRLATPSKKCLKSVVDFLGDEKKDKLLVSVGGVMTPKEVLERLDMGADLVQVYSPLVFHYPFFFRKMAEYMELQGLPVEKSSVHI